jgi:hypothetical protein
VWQHRLTAADKAVLAGGGGFPVLLIHGLKDKARARAPWGLAS